MSGCRERGGSAEGAMCELLSDDERDPRLLSRREERCAERKGSCVLMSRTGQVLCR